MKKFNFGCIVKILALVAMILLGVVIFITCSGKSGCGCERIDKTMPDTITAPYKVTTVTHLYYAKKGVTNTDTSVTMTGWYEQMKNKWIYHENSETIPPIFHPLLERR